MRSNSSVLFVVLLLFLAAATKSRADNYTIRFGEHLGLSEDLQLRTASDSVAVRFTCETDRTPVTGSRLHLFIEHSLTLDAARSFLSITLNHGLLRSLRLDPDNAARTEVVVPIPPQMLLLENEFVLSVRQSGSGATDVWTAVKPDSFIVVEYEETDAAPELRDLPAPFVDVSSYREKALSVLLPVDPSPETLEAAALLVANYASRVSPEAVAVRTVESVDRATEPLLVVGTPREQPELLRLADDLPFGIGQADPGPALQLDNGETLQATDGLIGVTRAPGRASVPALVVTADMPEGVRKGVRNLISGRVDTAGRFLQVREDVAIPSRPLRDWDGYLPPARRFTLSDLEIENLSFGSGDAGALSLVLRSTPDARFLAFGHTMTLAVQMASTARARDAAIDLRLNGSSLGRFAARDVSMGSRASIRVGIPAELLERENELEIIWREPDVGQRTDPIAWLLPTTEFYLPRSYEARLPDLALLQYGLFPLGLRADLSDTVIVLDDDAGQGAFAALVELASALGRLQPADRLAFRVRREGELALAEQISSHFIFLDLGEPPSGSRETLAVLEESESPWNRSRYTLRLRARSPESIEAAIARLFSPAALERLEQDTAHVHADGIAYSRSHTVRVVRERSPMTYLEAWLRGNWMALPLILAVASGILFMGLRLALAEYRRRPPERS